MGTLGDPDAPTCSEQVARVDCKFKHVRLYGSFEGAAQDVIAGNNIDAFMVPAAYPQAFQFIHSAELRLLAVFVTRIAALVVAGNVKRMPDAVDVVYHHPATISMLVEIGCTFAEALIVPSNVAACRAVIDDMRPCVCITNKLAADSFHLRIYSVLRMGVPMPFFIFGAARAGHSNN